MKIFRIFKAFLNIKTHKLSQFLNKNRKQLTRKYDTLFNQDSTYDNITQISKDDQETHRNFLEILRDFFGLKTHKYFTKSSRKIPTNM
jgi:acyl-[acyl carrier protein]--UDP-N-acetylglucosamine O-acyltransferase